MMMPRLMVAAWCVFGPLTCIAHGGNINGEATYVSFSVPGALGTCPMGINASMEVTGFYYTSRVERGFLRQADGTIITFAVGGATSTVPESINAAGDITGYYTKPLVYTQLGFLRYADGHIITFDTNQTNSQLGFLPAGINDFGEIAGNYVYHSAVAANRSRAGVFSSTVPGLPDGQAATATAINASGLVVGFYEDFRFNLFTGFVAHPDGYWAAIQLPIDPGSDCSNQVFPDAINAAGTIAGFFTKNYDYGSSCGGTSTGGFVVSPEGELTLFEAPGPIPLFDDHTQEEFLSAPHWISIDQAGDIAGSYTFGFDDYHGFVRNPYGTITSFDPPEGAQTHVTGINDGGAIAGYYSYQSMGASQLQVGFIRIPMERQD